LVLISKQWLRLYKRNKNDKKMPAYFRKYTGIKNNKEYFKNIP